MAKIQKCHQCRDREVLDDPSNTKESFPSRFGRFENASADIFKLVSPALIGRKSRTYAFLSWATGFSVAADPLQEWFEPRIRLKTATFAQNSPDSGLRFNGSIFVKRRYKTEECLHDNQPQFAISLSRPRRTFNPYNSSNAKAWVVKAITEGEQKAF